MLSTTDKIFKALEYESHQGHDLEFIVDPKEFHDEVEKGQQFIISKFGLRQLDHHAPFKSSHLIMNIGHPNVGKSIIDLFLLVMLARTSGLKFIIYSAENRIGAMVRYLIQFYWSKPYQSLSKTQRDEGFQWAIDHFKFIAHTRMYTCNEILHLLTEAMHEGIEFSGAMVDPYNALRLDLRGLSKNDYNIQCCEQMRVWCELSSKTLLLNCHTTTEAQRQRDKDGFTVKRPFYTDVEGGGPFTAKADDAWVTHRNVRDPERFMYTEMYVEKIRNQEYGGQITGHNEPIMFRFRQDRSGYDIEPSTAERAAAQKDEVASRAEEARSRANQQPLWESAPPETEDLPF